MTDTSDYNALLSIAGDIVEAGHMNQEDLARLRAHLGFKPDTAPAAADGEPVERIALHEWAVSRWRAEVEYRPLQNVHRRTLDDTWRQVIRFAGGDPDAVVGPSHDDRLAADVVNSLKNRGADLRARGFDRLADAFAPGATPGGQQGDEHV